VTNLSTDVGKGTSLPRELTEVEDPYEAERVSLASVDQAAVGLAVGPKAPGHRASS
jgi:hypothetical protein